MATVTLRRYWVVLASLMLLTTISTLAKYPYQLQHWEHWLLIFVQIGIYGLLIANTRLNYRSLWFFAVALTFYKLWNLLKFYLTGKWIASSSLFFSEYGGFFYRIKVSFIAQLLFGGPVAFIWALAIYCHWLYLLSRLLKRPVLAEQIIVTN